MATLAKIIAIVGSRVGLDWTAVADTIREIVERRDVGTVVSGGAIGVDRLAETIALTAGKRTHVIRPDWRKFGRSAGMRRNAEIVDMADEVYAFWDGKSPGTKGCVEIAKRAGKAVVVYKCSAPQEEIPVQRIGL